VIQPNPSTAMARVVVDELIRGGVRFAVVAPGSRSSALAIALVERDELEVVVHIDERSAGFRALGRAMASRGPAVVVTTSGSAVANLMPAAVEADRSDVPLILMTADRPADLVRRRANQTMVQPGFFDSVVRLTVNLSEATSSVDSNDSWRRSVDRLLGSALGSGGAPGPVHLNIAFTEPTVPFTDDGRTAGEPYEFEIAGAADRRLWSVPEFPDPPEPVWDIDLGTRPLLIAGRGDYDAPALVGEADSKGLPVLATALSGGRGPGSIMAYHHILVDGIPPSLKPTGVLVVGQMGPSSRLQALTSGTVPVVHIDRWGRFSDPSGTMTVGMRVDPLTALIQWGGATDPSYQGSWRLIQESIDNVLDAVLSDRPPSGPGVALAMNDVARSRLVVGSSLPIRDVDALSRRPGPIFSNRGLSGIDGFVSTAFGVAGDDSGVVGLAGDLSFLHDSNGFLTDVRPDIVMVVCDNNGGGLFDLLPQARHAPSFERLFISPHNRDLSALAAFHGVGYRNVHDVGRLAHEIEAARDQDGPQLVHVPVSRAHDVETREALDAAARRALTDLD